MEAFMISSLKSIRTVNVSLHEQFKSAYVNSSNAWIVYLSLHEQADVLCEQSINMNNPRKST